MLIYDFSESIEVCAQVFIDLEPNKDGHLTSQAASFVENSLSMYTSYSLSAWRADINLQSGSPKAG